MSNDRFLNPYNFVRYLDKPRRAEHVLGDCPPPPHDRYVGLTGRITCELKADTPLFVSDSHAVRGKVGEHRTFRFFQIENEKGELEPALPASSLRGMLRSVFEAATNSCFAVFDDTRRLEYREKPEYGNKVKGGIGIVNALPEPVKDGQPTRHGEIVLCKVAAIGAYYEGEEQWKNALGQRPDGKPWQSGDPVVARVERLRQGFVVRELSATKANLHPLGDHEEYVEGWLKIAGKGEGTSKRKELLVLNPNRHGSPGSVRFDFDQMLEYNSVLAGQLEREGLPALPQSARLDLGNLVYAEFDKRSDRPWRARRIVRVQVPRTPYRHAVGDLLSKHVRHCDDYDSLCPACRIFGWVHADAAELGKKERVAYAGRLRFSHGRLIGTAKTLDSANGIPLAILSTPKPTTTQFYLLDRKGQPDGRVDYNTPDARLRGRKFYRHHGKEPSQYSDDKYEYKRAGEIQDGQNRTVCGVLDKDCIFQFTIDFENLAPEELGALLWALQLEDGMHHRLGYGKPLGFGSVTITIMQPIQVFEPKQRFGSLQATGWKTVQEEQWRNWIAQFQTQMAEWYGAPFHKLVNIQDLKAVTSEPDVEYIHYPRLEPEPQPEGENFRWFVENKRLDEPHALGLATSDTGLPLIPGEDR